MTGGALVARGTQIGRARLVDDHGLDCPHRREV
jgi:hypothetical protein